MNLPSFFTENIRKYVSDGDSIVIALSGGPDSVALLYLLCSVRGKYNLKLYAAHFNHMLRGAESGRDALFAEGLCEQLDVPFFVMKKDIKKIALDKKGGVEKNARVERYRFLIRCALKVKAGKIALGHNLDDNAETVLMRLIYGAGGGGLSGIAAVRKILPGEFGVKYPGALTVIRPLSGAHKKEITGFLKKNRIEYVFDKTNSENVYTRNKLRNLLIPQLRKQYNPQITRALSSAGEILSVENDFINLTAQKSFAAVVKAEKNGARINAAKLKKYHPAIRRRIVMEALKNLFASARKVSFEPVESVLGCLYGDGAAQLPENFLCSLKKGWLVISRAAEKESEKPLKIALFSGKPVVYGGCSYRFRTISNSAGISFKSPDRAYVDLDAVKMPLTIRFKKPGDRFIPYGMDKEVRLKKFFNTAALDCMAPVIADRKKIIWTAGGRIDDRVKVSGFTKRILVIEKEENTPFRK